LENLLKEYIEELVEDAVEKYFTFDKNTLKTYLEEIS